MEQDSIAVTIYDINDSGSAGSVDFLPYTNAAHDSALYGYISAPQNVTISFSGNDIYLSWDEVSGATSYKVYSSDLPNTGFTEDTSGTFNGTNWSAPIPGTKKFYYVKAINQQ